jgi:single-strand DNA-binding protein
MNAMRNKVQLIGHLGEVPEITPMEGGPKKAAFTVTTTETFKNPQGEKVTETQIHKVVGWGKLAEIAEKYLVKGIEVAIEGKLVNSHYTDGKGIIRHVTEIHASELLILTKRS